MTEYSAYIDIRKPLNPPSCTDCWESEKTTINADSKDVIMSRLTEFIDYHEALESDSSIEIRFYHRDQKKRTYYITSKGPTT